MTIPAGATHILKEAHVDSVFFDYVKIEGDSHYSFNVNGWFLDNNISRFMSFYDAITDVDSDSEDACFNAESAHKTIINLN